MRYHDLLSPYHLALLSDWLAERHELYVDVDYPHRGGSSTAYFIHSLHDLKDLLIQQSWPELSLTIFRHQQYSLRGVVDHDLTAQALHDIPETTSYHIVSLDHSYPEPSTFFHSGGSHAELTRALAELIGQRVGIGVNPLDHHDEVWLYGHPNEVFNLTLRTNQNYYAPYAQHSERYQWIEELWRA